MASAALCILHHSLEEIDVEVHLEVENVLVQRGKHSGDGGEWPGGHSDPAEGGRAGHGNRECDSAAADESAGDAVT